MSSAQLDLFAARLPHRPYCTDDLGSGVRIRGKAAAIKTRYIQANPPAAVCYLVFDVDREGAAFAWDDRGLPPPSWAATNPENGHAHLAYAVKTPVVRTDAARLQPLRFMAAVQDSMTVQLEADPGYAMFLTKNPLNPSWRVLAHEGAVYELHQLADYVDLSLARKKPRLLVSGLGRNCDLFDNLRRRAYREVAAFREGGCYQTWWRYILEAARKLNAYAQPLPDSEVQATAKSVAKWVWRRFGHGAAVDRFRDRQKARQRRSAAARRGLTSARVVAAVEGLRRAGKRVTVSAVARISGVSRPTIYKRHLSLLTATLVLPGQADGVSDGQTVNLAKSDNSAFRVAVAPVDQV